MEIVRMRPKLMTNEPLTLDFESMASVIFLFTNYYSHLVLSANSYSLNTQA